MRRDSIQKHVPGNLPNNVPSVWSDTLQIEFSNLNRDSHRPRGDTVIVLETIHVELFLHTTDD